MIYTIISKKPPTPRGRAGRKREEFLKLKWYKHLKEMIESQTWEGGSFDAGYCYGQLGFALTAHLITIEQHNELSNMIHNLRSRH